MGLLTIASLLPPEWPKRLVDLNVEPLTEEHMAWADAAFISAMSIQAASADETIAFCRAHGVRIVAGGPHFTHRHDSIDGVDHFILGEAEEVMSDLIEDLAHGRARPIYRAADFPSLSLTPSPSWELIDFADYTTIPLQFSRGCPFDCEFCDVVALFGRRPRYKNTGQILNELEKLFEAGWRGNILIVDDNIIGNKKQAQDLLASLNDWQAGHGYPFFFVTQASINLADEPELMALMAQADFKQIFIGIETPSSESLNECNKHQNRNRDLLTAIRTIHSYGFEVLGGFILGFDSDPPTIFNDQIRFIEEAGIPEAMIGVLTVLDGTKLWERMEREGRLLGRPRGDNVLDWAALNFEPKMGREKLIEGYRYVLKSLYEPKAFYARALRFFKQYKPRPNPPRRRPSKREAAAFLRLLRELGFKDPNRGQFWRYMAHIVVGRHDFGLAMNLVAAGHHYWITSRQLLEETL